MDSAPTPAGTRTGAITDHVHGQLERARRYRHYNAVMATISTAEAEAADLDDAGAGHGRPLYGMTIGVKDNIEVAGIRTTMGSTFFVDHRGDEDASVVRRLRGAGAVPLLKTHLAEFAMGGTGQNQHYGTCRNAIDPSRISGGSSSGSAVAVALGLCDVALGTDTGGSILIPAALNGLAGLRPSVGRISTRGVFPVSTMLDRVGPIAPDTNQLRRVFAVLATTAEDHPHQAPDTRSPACRREPGQVRIGIPTNHFLPCDPKISSVLGRVKDALSDAGVPLIELTLDGAEEAQQNMVRIMFPDFAAVHADRYRTNSDGFGDDVRHRLEIGLSTSGVEYSMGMTWTAAWRRRLDRVFADVDLVLTPVTPVTAPRINDATTLTTSPVLTRFTHPWCLAPGPTLTVPAGRVEGLPVGVQLSGPPNAEELMFAVAELIERLGDEPSR